MEHTARRLEGKRDLVVCIPTLPGSDLAVAASLTVRALYLAVSPIYKVTIILVGAAASPASTSLRVVMVFTIASPWVPHYSWWAPLTLSTP